LNRHFERTLLRTLFVVGLLMFIPLIRKKPSKEMNEWLIVFLIKSYISSFLDTIVNKKGYVKYPVNLVHIFDISALFNYLLFPLSCVFFNQKTKNSSIIGILIKVLFFSAPMSIVENWLEKNTKLIKYSKGWNWMTSFLSITATFLLVRGLMFFIRLLNKKSIPNTNQQ
jgi:hypothetical protein